MKTYRNTSTFFFQILSVLLLCLPLNLAADDDCKKLYKDAEKYAEKEVADQKEALDKASGQLKEAYDKLGEAEKALKDFDNPEDPTDHDTDNDAKREKLEEDIEAAKEKILEAKAEYYDQLCELIEKLKELEAKIKAAETQCAKELAEAERERVKEELENYKTDLESLRDRHNLEERDDEPKEPEHSKKLKDDFVKAELDSLLTKLLEELKAAHPEAEDYREALREKIKEINKKWKKGFWDTPLGKKLKELLKKALQEEIDKPAEEQSRLPDEDSGLPKRQDRRVGEQITHHRRSLSLGWEVGFSSFIMKPSWCTPQRRSPSVVATDHAAVIVQSSGNELGTTDAQTSVTAVFDPAVRKADDPSLQETKHCLNDWSGSPYYALFLEMPLGKKWSIRMGGGLQEFEAQKEISTPSITGSGTVYSGKSRLVGEIKQVDVQLGLRHYLGQGRLRPLIGIDGLLQRNAIHTKLSAENDVPEALDKKISIQTGMQAYGGMQISLHQQLNLGMIAVWRKVPASSTHKRYLGLHFQLAWLLKE